MALAVVCGAFGAHALRKSLSPEHLAVWKTGVEYHFYHALGLFVLVILYKQEWISFSALRRSFGLIATGILLFSGSLYLLSTQDIHGWPVSFLGPVTPVGGVCFILGWLWLVFQKKNTTGEKP